MVDESLEPLEAEARAALGALRDVDALPAAHQDAIFARVAHAIAWLPDTPDALDAPSTSGDAAHHPAKAAAVGHGTAAKLGLGKIIATALIAGSTGIGAGVALDRTALRPSATVFPAVAPTVASAPSAPPPEPSARAIAAEDLPLAPKSVMTQPAAPQEAPSAKGLTAERGLLDVARSALARGEAREALAATEQHRTSYANGSLVEEREAIAIKALVQLGQ
jgi:hypothetical protein